MQCCWGLGARAFLAAVCDGYVHVLCCMQHVLYCMQSVCIQQSTCTYARVCMFHVPSTRTLVRRRAAACWLPQHSTAQY